MSKFLERWRKILEQQTIFPAVIVDIVFSYTMLLPKEQYKLKYSAPVKYGLKCWRCNHNDIFEGENLPDRQCKCGNYLEVRHLLNYHYKSCERCSTKDSFVEFFYQEDDDYFRACKVCSEINFCRFAEVDNEICLFDGKCFLCGKNTCEHGFCYTTSSGEGQVCVDCKEFSWVGRKFVETIVTEKPRTYEQFFQLLEKIPLPSPSPGYPLKRKTLETVIHPHEHKTIETQSRSRRSPSPPHDN